MKNPVLLVLSLVVITMVFSVSVLAIHAHDVTPTRGPDHNFILTNISKNGSFYGLSEETETKIKQDYLDCILLERVPEASLDDVFIFEYYGTFSGCSVVRISDRYTMYLAVITGERIGNTTIFYSDSNKAIAWKDGAIYSLTNAYEYGVLSWEDIQ